MTYMYHVLLVILYAARTCMTCESRYDCYLPECSCQHERPPAGLYTTNVPRMVLFTFSGPVSDGTWERLDQLFPDTLRNPNDCPVAITVFVRGDFHPCTVSALHMRGHEIATQGSQQLQWDSRLNWTNIIEHRKLLEDEAKIPSGHILGVRATDNFAEGGFDKYNTLQEAGFLYDSSLFLDFTESSYSSPPLWPFTMTSRFVDDKEPPCEAKDKCPRNQTFPHFWEVPPGHMFLPLEFQAAGHSKCKYLWECALYAENQTVTETLETNFERHFGEKRGTVNASPFVINIQTQLFAMEDVLDDLKQFIDRIVKEEDVWLVTFQDAIKWIQSSADIVKGPTFLKDGDTRDQGTDVFECDRRRLSSSCLMSRFRSASYYSNGTTIFWLLLTCMGVFFLFALRKR